MKKAAETWLNEFMFCYILAELPKKVDQCDADRVKVSNFHLSAGLSF